MEVTPNLEPKPPNVSSVRSTRQSQKKSHFYVEPTELPLNSLLRGDLRFFGSSFCTFLKKLRNILSINAS
jgi:hypothetical protein